MNGKGREGLRTSRGGLASWLFGFVGFKVVDRRLYSSDEPVGWGIPDVEHNNSEGVCVAS